MHNTHARIPPSAPKTAHTHTQDAHPPANAHQRASASTCTHSRAPACAASTRRRTRTCTREQHRRTRACARSAARADATTAPVHDSPSFDHRRMAKNSPQVDGQTNWPFLNGNFLCRRTLAPHSCSSTGTWERVLAFPSESAQQRLPRAALWLWKRISQLRLTLAAHRLGREGLEGLAEASLARLRGGGGGLAGVGKVRSLACVIGE